MSAPRIARVGFLDMQACVPSEYTDEQVVEFVESQHPCGTANGWSVEQSLGRVQCEQDPACVHVVVVA